MKTRVKALIVYFLFVASLQLVAFGSEVVESRDQPNMIIIFTDDQGYQDIGCYGSPDIKTPELDRMAEQGVRLTHFYVSSSVCSPSRASLLTGRLPKRHGTSGVYWPGDAGLRSIEVTIAEVLKPAGYRTACIGKWHLGDREGSLPTAQGFDEYYGVPFSNDMYISPRLKIAADAVFNEGWNLNQTREDQEAIAAGSGFQERRAIASERGIGNRVPLVAGEQIVEYPADQSTLTERFFDQAIGFIERSGGEPFFIYLAPTMPHIPLYASGKFRGRSERGLYGDVIEELDWNVGRLLAFLGQNGLDRNTLVIFTSDNGPWLEMGDHGGSALPLRGGKFDMFEGGVRVPFIARWPGRWVEGAESNEVVTAMDLLPTLAHYADAQLPEVPLDGVNVASHLEGPAATLPRTFNLYTSFGPELRGIRRGNWKYLARGAYPGWQRDRDQSPMLFDLSKDPSEKNNLYDKEAEIAAELDKELRRLNDEIR
ncbi:MAG: sulfatase-like hydrolase/transferase [Planctomycetota bacterium]